MKIVIVINQIAIRPYLIKQIIIQQDKILQFYINYIEYL